MAGGSIAQDALQYEGARYVFGGVPAHGRGQWDCSSFVNWVVGNDLGMAIPGFAAGAYHGQVHGPVVVDWASTSLCATVPAGNAAASDLVIWPGIGASGHIGIVTGSNEMISALDTSQGTVKTPIKGYGIPGISPVYRRVNGALTTASTMSITDPLSGCANLIPGLVPTLTLIYFVKNRRQNVVGTSNRVRGWRSIYARRS